jgi:NAD(P)-dependent dehydrogenase (short-subunit alcohol dehydrogenase family)
MTDTETYAKMDATKRDAYQNACRETSPLGRIANPDDIADSVIDLISNRNATGQVIMNDAGLSGV